MVSAEFSYSNTRNISNCIQFGRWSVGPTKGKWSPSLINFLRSVIAVIVWQTYLIIIIENYPFKPLMIFTKSFFNRLGSVLSVFGIFLTKGFSASSIHITDGCSSLDTFITKCINIIRPVFPGYLPTMFAGVRSNNVAPVSLQIDCIRNFLPLPEGPIILVKLKIQTFIYRLIINVRAVMMN